MKLIVSLFSLFLLYSFSNEAAALWNGKIFAGGIDNEISFDDLIKNLGNADIIVLGEEHDNFLIQIAESNIIKSVVLDKGSEGNFNLAWEFLNFSDQDRIQNLYTRFTKGEINSVDFLKETVNSGASYAVVIESLREMEGDIKAINLSRLEKRPVVVGGLSAIDPSLIPDGFNYGSSNYYQRFEKIMAGHTTPEKLSNYWDAQCLTDDVMAFHVTNAADKLTFVITGSFHADFGDGVVQRLRIRSPEKSIVVVRFVDASEYKEEELENVIIDPNYGAIAPFVLFVNEPLF
ncbi:MAG: hypothetical protein A3F16_05725 [Deltaproteobacteria bacterium RIFCSPHIGHO2_12_FULL_43_9]|nr:MAG: hypothetical protein A3F16_05725 [Deltaproteobacteria bacterium RIFCSPHIGHO2_12_FULL_43_9]